MNALLNIYLVHFCRAVDAPPHFQEMERFYQLITEHPYILYGNYEPPFMLQRVYYIHFILKQF